MTLMFSLHHESVNRRVLDYTNENGIKMGKVRKQRKAKLKTNRCEARIETQYHP